jgi:hypothetical protein
VGQAAALASMQRDHLVDVLAVGPCRYCSPRHRMPATQ